MMNKLLIVAGISALCCSVSCSSSSKAACNTYTDQTSCTAGVASDGEACVWYTGVNGQSACDAPTSPSDPVPQSIVCSDTLPANCNTHAVAGVPCYTVGGVCVSVTGCSVFDQTTCTDAITDPLVAGGCVWSTTVTPAACVANPTPSCDFNPNACSQYTGYSDNSGACNGVYVNGVAVCSWSASTFFGGTCNNNWPVAGTDPCSAAADQATCATSVYSAACSWITPAP